MVCIYPFSDAVGHPPRALFSPSIVGGDRDIEDDEAFHSVTASQHFWWHFLLLAIATYNQFPPVRVTRRAILYSCVIVFIS